DRVESLQQADIDRRSTAWLELVTAYADDKLPAPDKIARIYRDCGKGRADLERDGALLREHRSLEVQLAQVPLLHKALAEQTREVAEAIKARETAEKALADAQLRVATANNAHSATGSAIKSARAVELAMRHCKFNAIKPAREWSLSPAAQQLTAEIK